MSGSQEDPQVRLGALRFRINMGMKQIRERQAEGDRAPDGDLKVKLWTTVDTAMVKLNGLLWEFWDLAGHPFHCPDTPCEGCRQFGQYNCRGR